MTRAGIDLDDLVGGVGLSRKTLTKRLTEGHWKLVELALIAKIIGCPASELMPNKAAA